MHIYAYPEVASWKASWTQDPDQFESFAGVSKWFARRREQDVKHERNGAKQGSGRIDV